MLDRKLIQKEFGFLGDDIFLNVSQVCMPAKRVQEAYGSFMDDYVRKFGEGVVRRALPGILVSGIRAVRAVRAVTCGLCWARSRPPPPRAACGCRWWSLPAFCWGG